MADEPFDGPSFNDETLPVLRPRSVQRVLPRPPAVKVAGRSDVGLVREQNEDTFLIAELGRWLEVRETSLPVPDAARRNAVPQGTLLMVADGMGGHGGGEVASAVAVDTIAQFALYAMPWVANPDDDAERQILTKLGDAMAQCQSRLEQVAARKSMQDFKMGTTLTIAYVLWPKLYVAHAGDSRLYLFRERELVQITRDHTVGQALRDSGAIGEGPSRFDHILVNVVGGGTEHVKAEAHSLRLQSGDRIVLCSDGLTGHVSDADLARELLAGDDPATICDTLISCAKADGGLDNITVLVASF